MLQLININTDQLIAPNLEIRNKKGKVDNNRLIS